MEDEYSSDITAFMSGMENNQVQQQISPPIHQHPTQSQPQLQQQTCPIYNPQIPHMSQLPQIYQQANMNNEYFKQMEHFGIKFNTRENVLSVIVIVILFMLLASNSFKKIVGGISFLNMINGEYSLTSLFIIGFIFAIIYNSLKLFIF